MALGRSVLPTMRLLACSLSVAAERPQKESAAATIEGGVSSESRFRLSARPPRRRTRLTKPQSWVST